MPPPVRRSGRSRALHAPFREGSNGGQSLREPPAQPTSLATGLGRLALLVDFFGLDIRKGVFEFLHEGLKRIHAVVNV